MPSEAQCVIYHEFQLSLAHKVTDKVLEGSAPGDHQSALPVPGHRAVRAAFAVLGVGSRERGLGVQGREEGTGKLAQGPSSPSPWDHLVPWHWML